MSARDTYRATDVALGVAKVEIADVDQYPVLNVYYGHPEFSVGKVIHVRAPGRNMVFLHAKLRMNAPAAPPDIVVQRMLEYGNTFLANVSVERSTSGELYVKYRLGAPDTLYRLANQLRLSRPIPEAEVGRVVGKHPYYVAWLDKGAARLVWLLEPAGAAKPRVSVSLDAPPPAHRPAIYEMDGGEEILADAPSVTTAKNIGDFRVTYSGRVKWYARRLLFADVALMTIKSGDERLELPAGRYFILLPEG